jgi:indolepyruvate ferredoxin oxidoreductase beta subunit
MHTAPSAREDNTEKNNGQKVRRMPRFGSGEENVKEFNFVAIGVGGQGILTLASILAEAALKQGYDVKMSELHGLAQRGGSIPCQIRFGEKIYSSLVKVGNADLVIAMEPLEAMRAARFASSKKTVLIMNTCKVQPASVTILGKRYPDIDEIKDRLKDFFKKIIDVNATKIAEKETGITVTSNIYMLGLASKRGLLPIKRGILLEALEENVPPKYLEMNKSIFERAK